jgi:hypothetical protein
MAGMRIVLKPSMGGIYALRKLYSEEERKIRAVRGLLRTAEALQDGEVTLDASMPPYLAFHRRNVFA